MNYIEAERNIANILRGSNIIFNGQPKRILLAEKPSYTSGEGKTDIYCLLDDKTEIKISYKKNNADFLENKLTAKRAKEIFGKSPQYKIPPISRQYNSHNNRGLKKNAI